MLRFSKTGLSSSFTDLFWHLQNIYDKAFLRKRICTLTPFPANVPIFYPLKTPENLRFSSVFSGYQKEHWPEMG